MSNTLRQRRGPPSRRTRAPENSKRAPNTARSELRRQQANQGQQEGLSEAEARRRQAQSGYNELSSARTRPLPRLLASFWGPIPWMIEAVIVVSALLRAWPNAVIFSGLLLATAGVRFWEEYQASKLVAALEARLALEARVRRDGRWRTIPARELVRGDLIRLRLGDIVPADAHLVSGVSLEVDESTLTGESLPVVRPIGEMVHAGSAVERGEADAAVVATGQDAYLGRTAALAQTSRGTSHLQRTIVVVGNYLTLMAALVAAAILLQALAQGYDRHNWEAALQLALLVIVAAIPADMPTVLAITVAAGARLVAREQAIVSRLDSIEELARMDVVCADKTGTLTQNRLVVGPPLALAGSSAQDVLAAAALASQEGNRDPIDQAVLQAPRDSSDRAGSRHTTMHFQPFDPVRRYCDVAVRTPGGRVLRAAKGAPRAVLALCQETAGLQLEIEEAASALAQRGFRTLGVARTDAHGHWRFLGLLPLYDTVRSDAGATIARLRQLGVGVKLLSGDQLAIAREVAAEVGLAGSILDGQALGQASEDVTGEDVPTETARTVEAAGGFAAVYPEQKRAVIEALQRAGHVVGMAGDGVNDVLALKRANAAIAVAGATDAARTAADIVLLAPGLGGIVAAVRMSRSIVERIRTYVIYHMAETTRTVLFMGVAVLLLRSYPLTPIMLALSSALNAGALAAIAYDRAHASDQPVTWRMPVVLGVAGVLGITGMGASLGLYALALHFSHLQGSALFLPGNAAQSAMFLALALAGQLTIFVTRVRGPWWSVRPSRSLVVVVASLQVAATGIAVLGIFMTGIGMLWALVVWGYDLIWLLIEDRLKLVAYAVLSSRWPESPPAWRAERFTR